MTTPRRRLRRVSTTAPPSARRAIDVTSEAIAALLAEAGAEIVGATEAIVDMTSSAQAAIVASQLPDPPPLPGPDWPAAAGAIDSPAGPIVRPPVTALDAITARTSEQVTSLLQPLSEAAIAAMKQALIDGVQARNNPRRVAADMVRRVGGAFNGGLTRALTIARTEMLDAQRAAAMSSQLANSDTLKGWVWRAARGPRTCPACWSMDGSEHPLSESGPQGHQNCRCSRSPLAKTWAELGITGIREPPPLLSDARTAFDQLPHADQLAVMGPGRLAALRSGRVAWGDLAETRDNPGWRPAVYARPLRDLLAS